MSTKNVKPIRQNSTDLDVHSRNEDPLSGEKGAHPVGAGLGAAVGGAVVGAGVGTVAGPLGTIVGTIAGGIAGAYAGKAVSESAFPTVESDYWQAEHQKRPYYQSIYDFSEYEPAYRAGWESYAQDGTWHAAEPEARKRWEESWESEGGAPRMSWQEAQRAAEDAYNRAHGQARKKPGQGN